MILQSALEDNRAVSASSRRWRAKGRIVHGNYGGQVTHRITGEHIRFMTVEFRLAEHGPSLPQCQEYWDAVSGFEVQYQDNVGVTINDLWYNPGKWSGP